MQAILNFLNREFEFGNLSFTPGSLLLGLGLIVAVAIVAAILRRLLRDRLLPRAGVGRGVSVALSTLAYYVIIVIGVLVIMPLMIKGFTLETLSLILGAISFGIGFGLRNIADNFVSGLILLIERPIKVGDRIEVGQLFGEVMEIRARATIVRTNDHVDIIVPNSEFISGRVTNVSFGHQRVRFRFPVGVHYKSDVQVVAQALAEAGTEVEAVLQDPPPVARFVEFGDSSLNFELWVWTEAMYNRPSVLRSEVNFKIWEKLKKYGVEIPYPQRDVYIKEAPGAAQVPGLPH